MYSLIAPDQMPDIPGNLNPKAFYWVLRDPAPLAGMARPIESTPWQAIWAAGFRHVVRLDIRNVPDYDPAPLNRLYMEHLEDLRHGRPPTGRPEEEEKRLILEAASAATARLEVGEGVVIHCWGGTGRTGTVIACVLRVLGFTTSDIRSYFPKLNQARGKSDGEGWPEASTRAPSTD
ncbi:MAG: tyrosine-protein phosphatase [Chloroflexi bacterium]|nr:tyrosine-protein phosphatase [Chloroflexota bacterium]